MLRKLHNETDEVVIVLDGEMEFEVEGQLHRPQSGEELLISAGSLHSVRNIGNKTASWRYGYGRA